MLWLVFTLLLGQVQTMAGSQTVYEIRDRRRLWHGWLRAVTPYLFILPAIALVMAVLAYPTFIALQSSFTRWTGLEPPTYIGADNYVRLWNDSVFWGALRNTGIIALSAPLWVLADLAIASLLHQRIAGWKFLRSIFFLPVVMSAVVIGIIFNLVLGVEGPLNGFLNFVGLGMLRTDWLGNPNTSLYVIILVMWWSHFGQGVVIFMAGLSSVPPEYYELAKVEGANRSQVFIYVTVPAMKRIVEFYTILVMLFMFKGTFPYIFVMTQGGPGYRTMVLDYMIYEQAFRFQRMGYAATVGIALLTVLIVVTVLQWRLLGSRD